GVANAVRVVGTVSGIFISFFKSGCCKIPIARQRSDWDGRLARASRLVDRPPNRVGRRSAYDPQPREPV
ncbi:MAG TPA: hypothetical protein VHO91_11460, partial [Rhodopila sp.]|nr:hypothetical protein [Rhodopila sp.]